MSKKTSLAISTLVLAFGVGVAPIIFGDLWMWFVVPLGAPAIGHWHAYGLLLVVGFVTMGSTTRQIALLEEDAKTVCMVVACATQLLAWGIGALVHWGMG